LVVKSDELTFATDIGTRSHVRLRLGRFRLPFAVFKPRAWRRKLKEVERKRSKMRGNLDMFKEQQKNRAK
jgi:hypothetical protein